ncbi:MAG: response regulator [Deltaproteobacteria bacterium]
MERKKRILVVDDDKGYLSEIVEALNVSGYEARGTTEPAGVVAEAERARPDLILLDLKMPGMSGFDVASLLKKEARLSTIPILAVSAFYKDGDYPLAKVHGIWKCLHKPLDPEELIKSIQDLFNNEGEASNDRRRLN